ncbi:MAG: asparagine synthase (glutamine-hydrolyzing) [Bdellovibrionota bacterium]
MRSRKQPMTSSTGNLTIIFNGEIYNHQELRVDLKQAGRSFKGNSDTETIVEAIDLWGLEPTLKRLNGMFAIACWDRRKKTLQLARDRIGIKPVYYGWVKDFFVFASELKPFKIVAKHFKLSANQISNEAVSLFLKHNYIPAPYSIYQKIFKLEPGSFLEMKTSEAPLIPADFSPFAKDGRSGPKKYWDITAIAEQACNNPRYSSYQVAKSKTLELLRSSVKYRLMADVPLGVFLSGGIDSSLIASLAQEVNRSPIKSFSIGFHEKEFNEAVHAKKVAQAIGTDHTEFYLSAQDAIDVIPKLPRIYDEPFADSSQIPTFLVSELARRHVTIALSGDGGDEGFYGYSRYIWTDKLWRYFSYCPRIVRSSTASLLMAIPENLINTLYKLAKPLLPASLSFSNFGAKLKRFAEVLGVTDSKELYFALISHWSQPGNIMISQADPRSLLQQKNYLPAISSFKDQMMYMDYLTYIPDDLLTKVDRASMAVSLEVRVPFLDHRVIESALGTDLAFKYNGKSGKLILKDILYDRVPRELLERPKTGFGVPIGKWLRAPLRDWAEDLISKENIDKYGILKHSLIREKWDEHLSGNRNWQYLLWDVLSLQSWLKDNE